MFGFPARSAAVKSSAIWIGLGAVNVSIGDGMAVSDVDVSGFRSQAYTRHGFQPEKYREQLAFAVVGVPSAQDGERDSGLVRHSFFSHDLASQHHSTQLRAVE